MLLSARKVTKTYKRLDGKVIEVLKDVTLDIDSGDRIAIVGKSGAGKSTMLHVLGTLEEPTSGNVLFEGVDVFNFKEDQVSLFRNQKVGFVFQFHYLMLEFTALENVMMPALISGLSRKEASDRAKSLLDRVGLSERLDHKPSQLSGGEQQRIAIARSLMMKPKLLLTDEMTGNLDPITGKQVFELLESLHKEYGVALVSVTHDANLAAKFPRVYSLTDGILQRVNSR